MSTVPTGAVTFLFSDIEGSTRLWEEHPAEMKAALASHDEAMRAAIEGAGGYIFATGGDAFSAAFERPAQASEAAISAQSKLAALSVGEAPLRVRMALHTGTADERGGDYFGPALNRTARILSAGNGGQVLVSNATAELLLGSLPTGASLRDMGDHLLKDLSRPEKLFRLVHPGFPSDDRPLRSIDAFRHNLPEQLTSFVGREDEIAEVVKLLRGSRLVTLTAVGGTGKTRLALQVAAEVVPTLEDGAWFVDLSPLRDDSVLTSTVMSVLRLRVGPSEEPEEELVRHLANKKLLLILDNCEHLVEAVARLVELVLRRTSGISILATSRELLGLAGELPYGLKPLSVPANDDSDSAVLIRYPAFRLFVERGELARSGWRLSAEDTAPVAEICRRLDGIPLAIELAAARLAIMSPTEIAGHLGDRFRLLTGGTRTALPRQQTLRAAVDWSFDLLDDAEKVLFRRLSVFAGGSSLEAAKTVCGFEPLDEFTVLDLLGHLVAKSLVLAEETLFGFRYRMLETLRVYARDRLAETTEVDEIRRRHGAFFKGLASGAETRIRDESEDALAKLATDQDNFRAALNWAAEIGDTATASDIANGLGLFWGRTGQLLEGINSIERVISISTQDSPELVSTLIWAAHLQFHAMRLDESERDARKAVDLAERLDDKEGLSRALGRLGSSRGMRDLVEGAETHKRSRMVAVEAGIDASNEIWNEAMLRAWHGESDIAVRLADRFVEESPARAVVAKTVRGIIYQRNGNDELAESAFDETREWFVQQGQLLFGHYATLWGAPSRFATGHVDGLEAKVREALGFAEEHGAGFVTLMATTALGRLAAHDGDIPRARQNLNGAIRIGRKAGVLILLVEVLDALAQLAAEDERFDEAASLLIDSERDRSMSGWARPLSEQTAHEAMWKELRDQLGSEHVDFLRKQAEV